MTETADDILPLAAGFPSATREQWLALVAGVLKGAPFERSLVARTYDGLTIQPLYERDPRARPLAARSAGKGWRVVQRIDHPDPVAANAEALHDLENGATTLSLVLAGSVGSHRYGVAASQHAVAAALAGVDLKAAALDLDTGPHATDAARLVMELVNGRGTPAGATGIRFGIDPLGAMASAGAAPESWREHAPRFAGLVSDLAGHGFSGPFAAADGRVIHDAGGSEAQELGFVLAVAVSYLRALEASKMPLDAARRMIFFRLCADPTSSSPSPSSARCADCGHGSRAHAV